MSAKQRNKGKRHARKAPGQSNVVAFPGAPGEIPLEESQVGASVAMESILRVIRPMVQNREFESPEEMEAFLEHISEEDFRRARAELMATDPAEEAQLLAYQAMLESENDEEAAALARRALECDPHCVDALVLLAELGAGERVDQFIAALEKIVEKGRAGLGEPSFGEDAEGIWDTLEWRPYLRTVFRLAEALRISGRTSDAIARLEELMDRNPLDHQRAREPLLACYLALDEIGSARKLLFQFEGDSSAVFLWGRVLERYLSEDPEGALAVLRQARRQNPHAERYMTFLSPAPDLDPDSYMPGTQEEAVHCLYIMGLAWANYPEAIHWVRAH
jgi:tetratricopeptide (TPR) repeat protein